MIENELHFTNPISLVLAKSVSGGDLKSAKYISIVEDERFLKTNRNNSQNISISSKIAEVLGIDFDVIKYEEHLSNPAEIIESHLKKNFFPNGQTLIMHGGDNYCRFGFRNYANFPITKYRLKKAWEVVNFPVEDLLYGCNIEDYKKNSRNIHNTFNLKIPLLKKIVKEIIEKSDLNLHNIFKNEKEKGYLLVMPYTHDRINEEFSKNFFLSVKNIAQKMDLGVIIKNHPADIYDYRQYFSKKEDIFFHQDISNRHIPVEFFLQSQQVKYTVCVPSSSLVFSETDRLIVHVPRDRDLFRRTFLDQIPFLNRLGISPTDI